MKTRLCRAGISYAGLFSLLFVPATAFASANSLVKLNSLNIQFLDAFLTEDSNQSPLVYFDDFEISSPYVKYSIASDHSGSNIGNGSSAASGNESIDGLSVVDWSNANDYFEPSSPALKISGQSQSQALDENSKFSSSYASSVGFGVSSFMYDENNDPLDITLRFAYSFDWEMVASRDTAGQASGFVTLEYALDSIISDPFAYMSVYDAGFGAGLNFPLNIDESAGANVIPPIPASGEIWISIGGVDYAEIGFQATVGSFSKVDPSPVPLPPSAFMLMSGLTGLMMIGRRRNSA